MEGSIGGRAFIEQPPVDSGEPMAESSVSPEKGKFSPGELSDALALAKEQLNDPGTSSEQQELLAFAQREIGEELSRTIAGVDANQETIVEPPPQLPGEGPETVQPADVSLDKNTPERAWKNILYSPEDLLSRPETVEEIKDQVVGYGKEKNYVELGNYLTRLERAGITITSREDGRGQEKIIAMLEKGKAQAQTAGPEAYADYLSRYNYLMGKYGQEDKKYTGDKLSPQAQWKELLPFRHHAETLMQEAARGKDPTAGERYLKYLAQLKELGVKEQLSDEQRHIAQEVVMRRFAEAKKNLKPTIPFAIDMARAKFLGVLPDKFKGRQDELADNLTKRAKQYLASDQEKAARLMKITTEIYSDDKAVMLNESEQQTLRSGLEQRQDNPAKAVTYAAHLAGIRALTTENAAPAAEATEQPPATPEAAPPEKIYTMQSLEPAPTTKQQGIEQAPPIPDAFIVSDKDFLQNLDDKSSIEVQRFFDDRLNQSATIQSRLKIDEVARARKELEPVFRTKPVFAKDKNGAVLDEREHTMLKEAVLAGINRKVLQEKLGKRHEEYITNYLDGLADPDGNELSYNRSGAGWAGNMRTRYETFGLRSSFTPGDQQKLQEIRLSVAEALREAAFDGHYRTEGKKISLDDYNRALLTELADKFDRINRSEILSEKQHQERVQQDKEFIKNGAGEQWNKWRKKPKPSAAKQEEVIPEVVPLSPTEQLEENEKELPGMIKKELERIEKIESLDLLKQEAVTLLAQKIDTKARRKLVRETPITINGLQRSTELLSDLVDILKQDGDPQKILEEIKKHSDMLAKASSTAAPSPKKPIAQEQLVRLYKIEYLLQKLRPRVQRVYTSKSAAKRTRKGNRVY